MKTLFQNPKSRYLWLFAALLPCALFGVVKQENSWRPKTLRLGAGYSAFQVTFSFDSQRLAVAYDNTKASGGPDKLLCWDVASRQPLWNFSTDNGQIASIAFLPDSHDVISLYWGVDYTGAYKKYPSSYGGAWTVMHFHKSSNGRLKRTLRVSGAESHVRYLCNWPNKTTMFHINDDLLLTDMRTGKTHAWRLNKDALKSYPGSGLITDPFALSPDGSTIALMLSSGQKRPQDSIALLDSRTHRIKRLLAYEANVYAYDGFTFSPNSRLLAMTIESSSSASISYYLQVCDVRTAKTHRWLLGNQLGIQALAFSPDNQTIAIAGGANSIALWNASNGTLLRTVEPLKTAAVFSLAFSPNGTTLASGFSDGTVKLYRVK